MGGKTLNRVLVCGGREYHDAESIFTALDIFHQQTMEIGILIEGGARGADKISAEWAKRSGIHFAEVPALWDVYKKKAGPFRNAAMLFLNPQYCIAFPGGTGTENMVNLCTQVSIPVWRPYG